MNEDCLNAGKKKLIEHAWNLLYAVKESPPKPDFDAESRSVSVEVNNSNFARMCYLGELMHLYSDKAQKQHATLHFLQEGFQVRNGSIDNKAWYLLVPSNQNEIAH